jgi:Concanavalin A-like lectin/glucanases superfamily
MTRDSTTGIVQLYVDGVLNGASGFDTGSKTSQFFLIGGLSVRDGSGNLTGANYFNGQLDEVRIYNRVLTPAEISEIGQIPAAPTGLSANPYSGSIVQLSWTNTSSVAQNVEVQRKTGLGGTYQQIAILNGSATGYTDINLDAGTQYYYRVRAIDLAGSSPFSIEANATPPRPTVVGRYAFYFDSSWVGQVSSSHLEDGLAIAPDKQALLPGQTATFQNYTSFSKGLNGIMMDLTNFDAVVSTSDFTFLMGNGSDTGTWQPAPAPNFVSVYPGAGVDRSTRLEIVWDNNQIQNEWLQVTLKADAVTKLAVPDVFYFGNAIGESGNSPSDAVVDAADELAARSHGTGLLTAAITSPYDFNRDKRVDTADQLIARSHAGEPALQLITAPVMGAGAAAISTIVDTSTATPLETLVAQSAPGSQHTSAIDSALLAIFPAPSATAISRSPLIASSGTASQRVSLLDDVLLTNLVTTGMPPRSVLHQRTERTSDANGHPSSGTSPSTGDFGGQATDEALAIDFHVNQLRLRRAHQRGAEA